MKKVKNCKKIKYRDQTEAVKAKIRLATQDKKVSSYKCGCGFWHVTHIKMWPLDNYDPATIKLDL